MGLVLSIWKRFRRKATTKEVLEGIEEDINALESSLHRNRELQKRTALTLILFSIGIYLLAATIFYIWFLPDNWSDRLVWTLPFLCFPFVVTLLKRFLHFIFVKEIEKNAKKVQELNKQKRKILEEVMDNETYKVAKELLDKYDPHGKLVERDSVVKLSPARQTISPGPNQQLTRRPIANKPGPIPTPPALPRPPGSPRAAGPMPRRPPLVHQSQSVSLPPARESFHMGNGQGTPNHRSNLGDTLSVSTPNLTCPILPRDRSLFDKVAEYFIGDGPNYRYALICKQCFSHNGMALEDEFEFTAFRCCYCGMFNPSRKERLSAPSLEDMKDNGSEGSSTATLDSQVRVATIQRQGSSQDMSSSHEDEDSQSEKASIEDEEITETTTEEREKES